ncbi:MAG: ABC transporter permease [Proteobacteria bacterium]|nr:ABC transporter permease [Pseudomonadota bacterium]
MMKTPAIALNTFREAIRNKVLYSLLFFAVVVIVASLAFGALSVHEEVRLTTDLGFAGMSAFLVLIATFLGVNLVYKELERKTVYTLLPKPIHRYQFVLGKFFGLALTLLVLLALMCGVLLLVLHLQGAALEPALAMLVALIFLEVLVVTAVAVFFSSFSTPLLSGLFTVGVFLLGRSVPDIRAVAAKLDQPGLPLLLRGVARVVPNLRYFYVTGAEIDGQQVAISGTFVDWGYVGLASGYAALYLAVVLLLAMALFSRRDLI